MKREIKFRAWDKEKGMLNYRGIFNTPNFFDNSNLMQYTGLKDKNGRDVYEGDILELNNLLFGKVEFKFGCYRVYIKDAQVFILGIDIAQNNIEIIGNIYENPKLLTNKEL